VNIGNSMEDREPSMRTNIPLGIEGPSARAMTHTADADLSIVCPRCGASYRWAKGAICRCGHGIEVRGTDGARRHLDYYWGEIAEDEMRSALNICETRGWRYALRDVGERDNGRLGNFLLRGIKSHWVAHCLRKNKFRRVLDVGSGWGQNTFALVDVADEVWSVEGVNLRGQFQRMRRDQDGIENLHIVQENFMNLPFRGRAFDLIVVNGVLEWAGITEADDSPLSLQKRFLRQLASLLTPDGVLYIGIENRTGIQYFLGGKDHRGTRLTSLMPRAVASLVTNLYRRFHSGWHLSDDALSGYRTYTHTYRGYKSLLAQAGLSLSRTYWALPSYNAPRLSGLVQSSASIGLAWPYVLQYTTGGNNRILEHTVQLLGKSGSRLVGAAPGRMIEMLAPNFLLFATFPSFQGRWGDDLFIDTSLPSFRKSRICADQSLFLGAHGAITTVAWGNSRNRKDLRRQARAAFQFGNSGAAEFQEVADHITTASLKDAGGRAFNANAPKDQRLLVRWLKQFHAATYRGAWNLSDYRESLRRKKSDMDHLLFEEEKELLDVIIDRFCRWLEKERIVLQHVNVHGDLTSDNMKVTPDGQLVVFDWEFHEEGGDHLADAAWFALVRLKKLGEHSNTRTLVKLRRAFDSCRWLFEPLAADGLLSTEGIVLAAGYAAFRGLRNRLRKPGAWTKDVFFFRSIMESASRM